MLIVVHLLKQNSLSHVYSTLASRNNWLEMCERICLMNNTSVTTRETSFSLAGRSLLLNFHSLFSATGGQPAEAQDWANCISRQDAIQPQLVWGQAQEDPLPQVWSVPPEWVWRMSLLQGHEEVWRARANEAVLHYETVHCGKSFILCQFYPVPHFVHAKAMAAHSEHMEKHSTLPN